KRDWSSDVCSSDLKKKRRRTKVQPIRKIIILTIAIMLFIPYSFMPLQAKEKKEGSVSSKDEVVYATLEATGEHDEVFVVNLLNVTKAGKDRKSTRLNSS